MQAGSLVRYVDGTNTVRLGLLTADATAIADADIVPLDSILSLGSLVLGPITVGIVKSSRVAGGPPYWVPESD